MSPTCSAPVLGHRTARSFLSCPVHGATPARSATDGIPVTATRDERLLMALAADTPPATLELLSQDWDAGVRKAVARHADAPLSALESLAFDGDVSIRRAAAAHESTPPHVLEELFEDHDGAVSWRAKINPSASEESLERLEGDHGDLSAVKALTKNPSTPPEVLGRLANMCLPEVEDAVARHPNTPTKTLLMLAGLLDAKTRSLARKALTARMCATFDIDEGNVEALDMLREQEWWDMTPESSEVVLAKTLFPNA